MAVSLVPNVNINNSIFNFQKVASMLTVLVPFRRSCTVYRVGDLDPGVLVGSVSEYFDFDNWVVTEITLK